MYYILNTTRMEALGWTGRLDWKHSELEEKYDML
jgi:hypothetical protein